MDKFDHISGQIIKINDADLLRETTKYTVIDTENHTTTF
jgi:hypothetical protein